MSVRQNLVQAKSEADIKKEVENVIKKALPYLEGQKSKSGISEAHYKERQIRNESKLVANNGSLKFDGFDTFISNSSYPPGLRRRRLTIESNGKDVFLPNGSINPKVDLEITATSSVNPPLHGIALTPLEGWAFAGEGNITVKNGEIKVNSPKTYATKMLENMGMSTTLSHEEYVKNIVERIENGMHSVKPVKSEGKIKNPFETSLTNKKGKPVVEKGLKSITR